MNKMLSLAAPFAMFAMLSACGDTGEEAEVDIAATPAALPVENNGLGAPDEAAFSAAYAKACPDAEAVASSICQAAGMGAESFVCEFGLGDTEARRQEATLIEGESEWIIENPETACPADTE